MQELPYRDNWSDFAFDSLPNYSYSQNNQRVSPNIRE